MVDMIEARKRAKTKLQASSQLAEKLGKEPETGEAKPVVRAEPASELETPSYFPVETPAEPAKAKPAAPASPLIPAEVVPEDQVDFLQRLFAAEDDEEDTDQLSEVAEEELEVLVFQLGKEKYAMSIHDIAEIIRFMEPTEVPHTVGFLDGIVSLRGKMIPVINGRKRLGHPAAVPDRKTRIIVIRQNNENFGMLVDSASQVIRIQKKSIEATPAVVTGVDAEFINGVCEHKNQILILLNLDRFLQFQ